MRWSATASTRRRSTRPTPIDHGQMRLSESLRQRIVDHCIAALPNEGCGMLAVHRDEIVEVYPTANEDSSPTSYTIPPTEHFAALTHSESRGWDLRGVFHSHPSGPAQMSAVDLDLAPDPRWVYLVVGLGGIEPVIAAWSDGQEISLTP